MPPPPTLPRTLTPNSSSLQIGSFYPIEAGDWSLGAFISDVSLRLVKAAAANDAVEVRLALSEAGDPRSLLVARDFLGRSALHVAAAANAVAACGALLEHPDSDEELLQASGDAIAASRRACRFGLL